MPRFISDLNGWQFVHYIPNCHSIWKKGTEYAIADDSAIDIDDEHSGPEYTDDGVLIINRNFPIVVEKEKIIIPLFKEKGGKSVAYPSGQAMEPTSSLCDWTEALWLHQNLEMAILLKAKEGKVLNRYLLSATKLPKSNNLIHW